MAKEMLEVLRVNLGELIVEFVEFLSMEASIDNVMLYLGDPM